MKLAIIGGTGKTGKALIKQGLDAGHTITAMVRNPNKLKISHPLLDVVVGNVLNKEDLIQAFKGKDAVLSALGHKRFFLKTTILSRGTDNILKAMEINSIDRFICITSMGINDNKYKLGVYYTLFVIPVIIFFYFKDKAKQEKLIIKSNSDWTIVRPGQLTNGRLKNSYKHGSNLGSYLFTKMISRASVAHFMLQQLNSMSYSRKLVCITN